MSQSDPLSKIKRPPHRSNRNVSPGKIKRCRRNQIPCHAGIDTQGASCQKRRWRLSALIIVASALTLLACSDDRGQVLSDGSTSIADELRRNAENFEYSIAQPGGTLTFATISEPLTFNPALSRDRSSSAVLEYLFEGLTETSWLTDEVEPALAESWRHSSDGPTWTFLLRRDLKRHDGEPFTARDVEFTFYRIIYNPEIEAKGRSIFTFRFLDEETGNWMEDQMSVTALDDYTIRCVVAVPFAP